jgi:hypothetical protein
VLAWLLIAGSLGLYRLYDLATARPLRGGTRESR